MARRGRIAVVLTVTLFTVAFAGGRAARYTFSRPEPQRSRISAAQTVRTDDVELDIYGNGISEAVATYKIDSAGAIYEEHSPQTEVLKLGSPKS